MCRSGFDLLKVKSGRQSLMRSVCLKSLSNYSGGFDLETFQWGVWKTGASLRRSACLREVVATGGSTAGIML